MILGIGTDIIEIARIERAIQERGERFLGRLFTDKERAYCEAHVRPAMRYAGRWAAKEAMAKAMGTGFREAGAWQQIEILNDELGKPVASLSGVLAEQNADATFHISISHCEQYATATAIREA